uniref:G-patch domain-containing protein n=1 Tax=Culex tarsalis TaxID=7177 RepID=A0A1Q3EY41_CULTA
MPIARESKRKSNGELSWKSKIIRQFVNGWIESDNIDGTESPSKAEANPVAKPNAPKKNTQYNYPNFVKSSEEKTPAPATVTDPGLDKRTIRRIENVIAYFYGEDKISLKLSFEQAGLLLETSYDETGQVFRYTVNEHEICRAVGPQQEAHTKARDELVRILQFYCYTVKRLKEFHTRRNVFRKMTEGGSKQNFKDNRIDEGNIGFRMLQKQGWSGGSLGSSEEGILEPIGVQKKNNKSGLGTESSEPQKIPLEAFMLAIKQYAAGNALYDLVFSPQFSVHHVQKLRDLASSLKLFPQMIGKKKQLVISKNLTLREIKEGVLKGHSDLCAKYAVIPPISQRFK